MATIINLREWVMKRIESGKVENEKKLSHLYYHHMRMRMQEAYAKQVYSARRCPKRN